MTRPLRIQFPGVLYHITNRGNERKAIFNDDIDQQIFLEILSQSVDTYNIHLHSFVLMENHWHLLAQTPLANLSEFMRHLNITYTSHYNRRHKRTGHFYQGRYKRFLVEQEAYLSKLSRYIHLNPVRVDVYRTVPIKKKLKYLLNSKWSSLPGYVFQAEEFSFIAYDLVLHEYGKNLEVAKKNYKKQIVEDLTSGLSIKEQIIAQSILGSDNFVSWVKDKDFTPSSCTYSCFGSL